MRLPHAHLEDWMREYYFDTAIDLGSSGVQCWSLAQLRQLVDIDAAELDGIVFDDSPTYGGDALRTAVANRFLAGDADRVLATHGSTEAIFLAMNALLAAGDEVVVVDPGYHSLRSVAQAVGCRLTSWRLRAEDGFVPDLDALRAVITPRTRMVVVNFPNNPTGASLTPAGYDEFLDIVAESGAYLVWDGAFTELVYDAEPLPEPALRYDRCVSIGTMSKAYGLPGARVGWCLAAPDILASLVPLRDAITICLSPFTEYFAARAIESADEILQIRRTQAAHNLDRLAVWVRENAGLVSWTRPMGGCTAFPAFTGIEDTEQLCRDLGREHDVLLVPGTGFGHRDRVRLGFGGPGSAFCEGLRRLRSAIENRWTWSGRVAS
jgi:capreomycidine synthase